MRGPLSQPTRHLPALQEKVLFEIENAPTVYDGRTGKAVDTLVELSFAEIIERDAKNPRKVKLAITARGKCAIERVLRGVDPYLVLTD